MHPSSPDPTPRTELPREGSLASDAQAEELRCVDEQDADEQDAAELRRFGYLQQLRRSLGWFSSFAVSFSIISISTGIFANYGVALESVGPSLLWSWCLVVVGQFLVALVLADLAIRYPISGYGYQWASRLVNPHFGFFVGWLLLLQWILGFPGVCQTLAVQLHALAAKALDVHHEELALTVPWLTVGVVTVTAIIQLLGLRLAALVNSAGVIAEITGATLITLILLAMFGWGREDAWQFLTHSRNFASGTAATWGAFGVSLLMGAWCITGFEAAADLAEETHQPRQNVPRAILTSELSAGIAGFFLLLASLLAIEDLPAMQQLAHDGHPPILEIIERRLGSLSALGLMAFVMIAMFNCGLACLAHLSRLIFALARDNMLPFSETLKAVHPRWQTPVNAVLVVWLLSCLVALTLENIAQITSVAVITGSLGYGLMVLTALAPAPDGRGTIWRSRQGVVAGLALVWTAVVLVAIAWPRDDAGWKTLGITALSLLAGAGLYGVVIRGRLLRGEAGPPTEAVE